MSTRRVLAAQGAYYVATGVWPVVHRSSFEAVTGAKTDFWLVRMVGLLATAIGTTLLVASRREQASREATVLAVGAGASFGAIDVVYVARRRISPIYLGDATVHAALARAAIGARRRAGERS